MQITRSLNGSVISQEDLYNQQMSNDTLNYLFSSVIARIEKEQQYKQNRIQNAPADADLYQKMG